jgi:hypothetical protein
VGIVRRNSPTCGTVTSDFQLFDAFAKRFQLEEAVVLRSNRGSNWKDELRVVQGGAILG